MSSNPKTVEGIYRDGKVELLETPTGLDETRVIVTFLAEGAVNLSERGIDETLAIPTHLIDREDIRFQSRLLGSVLQIRDGHPVFDIVHRT